MIDIHCHLLPGIDDGPDTIETAVKMARLAVADGITHAIMTPHIHPGRWENTTAIIAETVKAYSEVLRRENVALKIGFAAEVRLTDQIFTLLENGQIPFLGGVEGYQIMLLEFPHSHVIPGSNKLIDWLIRNQVRPLIVHPERNKEIMAAPERLKAFIDQGCMTQITAGSLVGRFGDRARAAALYFLENDQIDLIATDAHNQGARPPILSEAARFIASERGEDEAHRLVRDTPWRLVSGQFESGE